MNVFDKLILETAEQEFEAIWPDMKIILDAHESVIKKLEDINSILKPFGFVADEGKIRELSINDLYYEDIFNYVIKVISEKSGIPIDYIQNKNKKTRVRKITQVRQMCYFFLIPIGNRYGKSIQDIATFIAGQDHATALWGKKTIFDLLSGKNEIEIKIIIKEVIKELKKKPYLIVVVNQIEREVNKIINE